MLSLFLFLLDLFADYGFNLHFVAHKSEDFKTIGRRRSSLALQ